MSTFVYRLTFVDWSSLLVKRFVLAETIYKKFLMGDLYKSLFSLKFWSCVFFSVLPTKVKGKKEFTLVSCRNSAGNCVVRSLCGLSLSIQEFFFVLQPMKNRPVILLLIPVAIAMFALMAGEGKV